MSASVGGKIDRNWTNLQRANVRNQAKGKPLVDEDIVEFCEKRLHIKPTSYQKELLLDPHQFIVCRWSRQSGKSLIVAILLLYYALKNPGMRAVVVGPSLRQSRKMIGKISLLLPRLGVKVLEGRVRKGLLEFKNGSTIEALPSSHETIRGETLDIVVVDEWNYVENDRDLYDAIAFALLTTNGRFYGISTPGSRDSMFYAMNKDDELFGHVSRHHVSYRDALQPNGPLRPESVEVMKVQMKNDSWRWAREMEAEFAEDEDTYFPRPLIEQCVVTGLNTFTKDDVVGSLSRAGSFYVGVDLGQIRDPSAVAVVEKRDGKMFLLHLRTFPLGTEYGSVQGYLKLLSQKLQGVRRISIDQTGGAGLFVEDLVKTGLKNATGVKLTLPSKQLIMENLKRSMEERRIQMSYDADLIDEMNGERVELMKSGQLQFSHPSGTHDDRLWALALAVHAARSEAPKVSYFATTGRAPGRIAVNLPKALLRPFLGPLRGSPVTNDPPGAPVGNRNLCLTCGTTSQLGMECPYCAKSPNEHNSSTKPEQ